MGTLLSYSLSASIIVMVLYPVLYLIVNRSTYFHFNRVSILCGLLLALGLPYVFGGSFISFLPDIAGISNENMLTLDPTISDPSVVDYGINVHINAFHWLPIVLIVYFSGIIVLIIREIISYIHLFRIIAMCEKKTTDGLTICRVAGDVTAPFSWGKYIFLNDSEYDNSSSIYIHEKAHTDKQHWIDILSADILCILLWYNPFAWMLRQLMKLNHEFEADDAVIRSGIDTYGYQRLLVVKAIGNRSIPIANCFTADKRSFRKRVLIMSKKRSSKKSMLLVFCVIPAVAIADTVLSMPITSNFLTNISAYSLSKDLLSTEKNSYATPPNLTLESDNPKTVSDSLTVIPSPFEDQTALANIIQLSLETIQVDKDTKINIEIVVDKDGRVKDVTTDIPDNDDIAVAISRQFNGIKFEQMTDNGQPVEVRFAIPIQLKSQNN